jgi:hypothetical protein
MAIRVVSLKNDSPCQAKPDETVIICDRTTKLGNPFPMKSQTEEERTRVIAKFGGYLDADIKNQGGLYDELMLIVDILDRNPNAKIALACHCAPLACHADLIKAATEKLFAERFRIRCRFHKDGTLPQQESTIFVFGSNEKGVHGAGAALIAKEKFGAIPGECSGFMGRSFGIPTKDEFIQPMPVRDMDIYFGDFCAQTILNPDLKFFVTRVGCGLAGNSDETMATLFKEFAMNVGSDLRNCSFAEEWRPFLV